MLMVVCLLAVAAAIAVAVRWAVTRVDSLGRVRDYPVISTVLCLVVAVACGVPAVRHLRFERRLSSVATTLAGRSVSVRCQTLSQAWTEARPEAGYVRFDADGRPESQATISVQTCGDLRAWVQADPADRGRPDEARLIAVHVLTHEAMHLAGETDEARTECAAVQRDVRTAMLLGADGEQARTLATRYWRTVYERLPDAYRSADCAPGAALDEHLPDAPWASADGSA